eukprot:gene31226-40886_t
MVGEKPKIAEALAAALGGGAAVKRRGVSPSSPCWDYDG